MDVGSGDIQLEAISLVEARGGPNVSHRLTGCMVDFLDYYVGDGEEPAPMPRRKILSTVKTKKRKDRTNKKASATGSRLTPNHVLVVDQKRKHSPSIQDHFFDLAIALKQSHCLAAQQAGLFN